MDWKIVSKHCGQVFGNFFKQYTMPINLCSGSPLFFQSLITSMRSKFNLDKVNEDMLMRRSKDIATGAYHQIVNDTNNRVKFDVYLELFKNDDDLFEFLSKHVSYSVNNTMVQYLTIDEMNKIYPEKRQILMSGMISGMSNKT